PAGPTAHLLRAPSSVATAAALRAVSHSLFHLLALRPSTINHLRHVQIDQLPQPPDPLGYATTLHPRPPPHGLVYPLRSRPRPSLPRRRPPRPSLQPHWPPTGPHRRSVPIPRRAFSAWESALKAGSTSPCGRTSALTPSTAQALMRKPSVLHRTGLTPRVLPVDLPPTAGRMPSTQYLLALACRSLPRGYVSLPRPCHSSAHVYSQLRVCIESDQWGGTTLSTPPRITTALFAPRPAHPRVPLAPRLQEAFTPARFPPPRIY
ncbi:hypothetical protein V8E36_006023, partial [Tilletia maclaganii]